MEIAERSSPNFGPRRDGLRPELVVLHYTAMATAEAALDRLCDPASEVSAHYLIAEDGRAFALVDEEQRAWHAGAGSWAGRGDVNSRSIGIELANAGPLAGLPPFPEPQMAALERLLDGILARWSIAPAGVIAHSDMAPGRKADPGPEARLAPPRTRRPGRLGRGRGRSRARLASLRRSGRGRRLCRARRRLADGARGRTPALAPLGDRPRARGRRRGGAQG